MFSSPRITVIATALLLLGAVPARAQRRVQLDVTPPTPVSHAAIVTTTNLFGDSDMRELMRSGFPASMRFRLELWRVGGLFNDLERHQDWELIIQYDPTAQRYRLARRDGRRLEDVGSFATLSTAQLELERPLRVTLLPERDGSRYYYNMVLNIEALSVSDMDQVERWLRGVRGENPAASLSSGVRTLMLRMLGGEKRTYERRSVTFVAGRG